MKTRAIPLGVLAFLVCTATAAETRRVGEATEQWRATQKSDAETVDEVRPLEGEAAQRSYERYLRSFEADIPARFDTGDRGE